MRPGGDILDECGPFVNRRTPIRRPDVVEKAHGRCGMLK